MAYPVTVHVEPAPINRNRLTAAFRLLLAIPHLILVGGAGFGVSYSGDTETSAGAEGGLLGAVVLILAIVSWFTILARGRHIVEIRQFTSFYLRWRTRALAYLMLLADPYPPFGDVSYPASIAIDEPQERKRASVAFRLGLAIPHFIALFFIMLAWYVTTAVAWVMILVTGRHPGHLFRFSVGALRWRLRVDAYLLLMVDEYPPFSLN